ELERRKRRLRDLEHGEIRLEIDADHGRHDALPHCGDDGPPRIVRPGRALEIDVEAPRRFDDMGVGDDVAVLRDDDARSATTLHAEEAITRGCAPTAYRSDRHG